jgi:hypothetical protein
VTSDLCTLFTGIRFRTELAGFRLDQRRFALGRQLGAFAGVSR